MGEATRPVFISGPSGVGKSYIVQFLTQNYRFEKIITTTTRPQRHNDIPDVTYHFIDLQAFDELDSAHQFVVSDIVFGHKYGLRVGEIETIISRDRIPICEVYSPSIHLFTEAFANALTFYLRPQSFSLLEKRLKKRGDSSTSIATRLQSAKDELDNFVQITHIYYAHEIIVTDDNFDEIISTVVNVVGE